jgi:hypothetical protein
VQRLDGSVVLAQAWSPAPPPLKKARSRYWPHTETDTPANSRDLDLPKGGADYFWLVSEGGDVLRAARPKATGDLVEVPDRIA